MTKPVSQTPIRTSSGSEGSRTADEPSFGVPPAERKTFAGRHGKLCTRGIPETSLGSQLHQGSSPLGNLGE
jgi:hypothetical protein